jgi:hypothetical protein
MKLSSTFEGKVQFSGGGAAWHFVVIPAELADRLRQFGGAQKRPVGPKTVEASLGQSAWTARLVNEPNSGAFLLPVSADVRKAENLEKGQTVRITITFDT